MAERRSVSSPGSLMLLGEHAVLHGHPCLVAAINRRVRVEISPRRDGLVIINSALGSLQIRRDEFPDRKEFRFIVGALKHLPGNYPDGLDVKITADMPPTIGFGTSAAVTVAMVAALLGSCEPNTVMQNARDIIQQVQGRGSGADAAASAHGGVVRYRINDASALVISSQPYPVSALYCGYKTPTPDVIKRVDEKWRHHLSQRDAIYARMAKLAGVGIDGLFGQRLNEGQMLMQELGVSTTELDRCVDILRAAPGMSGAKISGSGLGDCAIGWGTFPDDVRLPPSFELHRLHIEPSGVRFE